jgi:hypothetical protein
VLVGDTTSGQVGADTAIRLVSFAIPRGVFMELPRLQQLLAAEMRFISHQGCSGGDFDPCICVTDKTFLDRTRAEQATLEGISEWIETLIAQGTLQHDDQRHSLALARLLTTHPEASDSEHLDIL